MLAFFISASVIATPSGTVPRAMNRLEKSRPPNTAPTIGMMRSLTIDSTILPKAAPMMTPTARSMALPLTANSLNSDMKLMLSPSIVGETSLLIVAPARQTSSPRRIRPGLVTPPEEGKMPPLMRIGPHTLKNRLIVAPMAGVTDRPFRQLCKQLGAGMAVSEMVTSNSLLYGSAKTARRANHEGEVDPISVQIAGADPAMMAEAARHNVDRGAQIIDINMGCPAKKVCNVMAGSALLQDEVLVGRILTAVVNAVDVPVSLKIRTGWDKSHRNALAIARIAEAAGIQALAIHGRTRACMFGGEAEYETIAAVKAATGIPI